jgi:amino acid adenylation domain-containing protein
MEYSFAGELVNFNLALPLYRNGREHPQRLALSAEGVDLTYSDLAVLARNIGGALRSAGVKRGARVGILASRSVVACAGTLGACWSGATYVPISLKVPEDRLLEILALADFDALIADARGARLLSERVVSALPNFVLVPDVGEGLQHLPLREHQKLHALTDLESVADSDEPALIGADDGAYIIFTSGSTGVPKGVMISAGNVHHYVAVMLEREGLQPEDRVAESTELSFDLSVSNMFLTWSAGASLHVVPPSQAMVPGKFIRDNEITFWFSVPSIIALMKRVKALKPGSLPSLRYSLFAGEALPRTSAIAWHEAAPNSLIDCVYGPTETTIVCTGIRCDDEPVVTPERDTISIGYPFPGTEAAIVDFELNFLPQGEQGELALAGPQLALGYFRLTELSASRFPVIAGKRWYLSGDLAYVDPSGRFHALGRTDNQVKVLGNRVELEDVEAHLRAVCGTELVAAVAWPTAHGTADGIVAFVASKEIEPAKIRAALGKRIASYMMPTSIRVVEALPMNVNGKVDRKALVARLNGEKS